MKILQNQPVLSAGKNNKANPAAAPGKPGDGSEGVCPGLAGSGGMAAAEGVCNTPDSKPLLNTCVDYLKVRFTINFEESRSELGGVFQALCVDMDAAYVDRGLNNYEHRWVFGPGSSFWYGGNLTKDRFGYKTCVMELTGQGCRSFEDRWMTEHPDENVEMGWITLIREIVEQGGEATRIDLAVDDKEGILPLEEIKAKIKARHYTTVMRTIETTDADDVAVYGMNEGGIAGISTVKESKLSGYTATFGNRERVQLCIYDKAAERKQKGFFPDSNVWVRFESRYYHDNAHRAMIGLYDHLRTCRGPAYIAGCLKGLICFKEDNNRADDRQTRAKNWSKWDALFEKIEECRPFSTLRRETAIEAQFSWLRKSVSKTLAKVISASGLDPMIIVRYLIMDGFDKFESGDIMAINAFRRFKGLPEDVTANQVLLKCASADGDLTVPEDLGDYFARGNGSEA